MWSQNLALYSPGRAAAIVAGVLVGLFSGFPPIFTATLGVFLMPLSADFGWGRLEVSIAGGAATLGMAVAAPIVGRAIDRFGIRRVILVSVVVFSLSLAAFGSLTGNKGVYWTICFFVGFAGAATTPLGFLAVLPRVFDRRLGLALSIAMAGVGVGTIVMPPLANGLIHDFGWRNAYRVLGALGTVGALVACWIIGSAGDRSGPLRGAEAVWNDGVVPSEAFRGMLLWIAALSILLVSASTIGTSVHLVAQLSDRGVDAKTAAFVASVAGGGVLLGRVGSGLLFDYVRATWIGAASFLLAALGIALLWQGTEIDVWLAGSFLMGVALGTEGDLIAFIVRRYFGMKAFGAIYGVLMSAFSLGTVIGPVAMGGFFDRTGTYAPVLAGFVVACMAAALLLLTLGPYRYAVK